MDAVDGSCCFLPIIVAYLGLNIALSITGVVRRSGGYLALTLWIGALTGALVLRPLLWAEQDELTDSLWQWWAVSFSAPLVATVVLYLRREDESGST